MNPIYAFHNKDLSVRALKLPPHIGKSQALLPTIRSRIFKALTGTQSLTGFWGNLPPTVLSGLAGKRQEFFDLCLGKRTQGLATINPAEPHSHGEAGAICRRQPKLVSTIHGPSRSCPWFSRTLEAQSVPNPAVKCR